MSAIDDLLRQFKEAVIKNAEYSMRDPKMANKATAAARECCKELTLTEQGRQGLIALMSDENPHVRSAAASRSLAWEPDRARKVLEEVRDSDGPGAFGAKWTLIEYGKGRLPLDD